MPLAPMMSRPLHRDWLREQAMSLLAFHLGGAGGAAGFKTLGVDGVPLLGDDEAFGLHDTARMVHCLSLAYQLGIPGMTDGIDQGMRFLRSGHRDPVHGGYFWAVSGAGPARPEKTAYGHAFVLLAAASAKRAGHPEADALLADATTLIETRFWDDAFGAVREDFTREWTEIGAYRGQNSNMHMTEALMAAYDVTGERAYLDKAVRIAALIIDRTARACSWRVAEHFDARWEVDRDYSGDPIFRPAGTTPGHALEWSRLLAQLWALDGRRADWMVEAAKGLFANAVRDGWDRARGGFYYTLDWDDRPLQRLRLFWPAAEGIGAAATLWQLERDPVHADWYERIWEVVAARFIDREHGGWFPELDDDGRPSRTVFKGKPDLYHAFQACLIPLLPAGLFLSGDLSAAF
jgi:sulfoquinovose isomerase